MAKCCFCVQFSWIALDQWKSINRLSHQAALIGAVCRSFNCTTQYCTTCWVNDGLIACHRQNSSKQLHIFTRTINELHRYDMQWAVSDWTTSRALIGLEHQTWKIVIETGGVTSQGMTSLTRPACRPAGRRDRPKDASIRHQERTMTGRVRFNKQRDKRQLNRVNLTNVLKYWRRDRSSGAFQSVTARGTTVVLLHIMYVLMTCLVDSTIRIVV